MIIRGILDNSLNGQICIRGFAPIKELARISKADYSYQRNPIERNDISDFLEKELYLFFPEIILGYKLKYKFDNKITSQPLALIQNGKPFTSNIDNTIVKIRTQDYKTNFDTNNKDKIVIAEINLDDSELNKLIDERKPPFSRIDGNHRLLAAENSMNEKVQRMAAPFCIILGEELFNNDGLVATKQNVFDKATKVFFHNINTKTIPLTSEENLKVLIDDEKCFSDSELQQILGTEGVLVRQLIERYSSNEFTGIQHIIGGKHRSCYLDIFKFLEDKSKIINIVVEALKSIDRFYANNDKLKANSSLGLLIAFVYYWLQDKKGKFQLFYNWVLTNHLFDTKDVSAKDIIEIFDKIASRKIMIFVAMPYFNNDENEVASHNRVYRNALEDIKIKNPSIDIGLHEIMNHKGNTVDIVQDILNKIENCAIFVGNITDNNPNVTYEMGWARALKKPTIIVREDGTEEPKSDYKLLYHTTYTARALETTLRPKIKENIEKILSEQYGFVLEK